MASGLFKTSTCGPDGQVANAPFHLRCGVVEYAVMLYFTSRSSRELKDEASQTAQRWILKADEILTFL